MGTLLNISQYQGLALTVCGLLAADAPPQVSPLSEEATPIGHLL